MDQSDGAAYHSLLEISIEGIWLTRKHALDVMNGVNYGRRAFATVSFCHCVRVTGAYALTEVY